MERRRYVFDLCNMVHQLSVSNPSSEGTPEVSPTERKRIGSSRTAPCDFCCYGWYLTYSKTGIFRVFSEPCGGLSGASVIVREDVVSRVTMREMSVRHLQASQLWRLHGASSP